MNFRSGLGAGLSSLPLGGAKWSYDVRPRYRALPENLNITEDQTNDGETRHRGVVSCLNRGYWNSSDTSMNGIRKNLKKILMFSVAFDCRIRCGFQLSAHGRRGGVRPDRPFGDIRSVRPWKSARGEAAHTRQGRDQVGRVVPAHRKRLA